MAPTTHTHTIELTDEGEARLRAKAARAGLSVGDWLQKLADKEAGTDPAEELLRAYLNRTPEQIAADREAVMRTAIPPRPLPPGKTLEDVVVGIWPGMRPTTKFTPPSNGYRKWPPCATSWIRTSSRISCAPTPCGSASVPNTIY